MPLQAVITGTASRVGGFSGWSIDSLIREVVLAALEDAGIASLEDIDTLVSVGSDILDGTTVAGHSGIAGSYGHSLMTVCSSAGHALAASAVLIESGAVCNVLLAGWGEGTKFVDVDGRLIQADPFYARPLGAGAAELAVLQAQRLAATGRLDPASVERYARAMGERIGSEEPPAWLKTHWTVGACALVLAADEEGSGGVVVRDFGSSFQPYCPEPDELDPAGWVAAARRSMRDPGALEAADLIALEVAGPTLACEAMALTEILAGLDWELTDERVNPSGAGATSYFGPATGLQHLVGATQSLGTSRVLPAAGAAVIDLAGPIGQATTMVLLERGDS